MIRFRKENNLIILAYQSDRDIPWAFPHLKKHKKILLNKTFTFLESDLYSINLDDLSEDDYYDPIEFIFARLEYEYFRIENRILGTDNLIFIHKDIILSPKFFTAVKNISIFKKINEVVKCNLNNYFS